jgi:hypothetical protein
MYILLITVVLGRLLIIKTENGLFFTKKKSFFSKNRSKNIL